MGTVQYHCMFGVILRTRHLEGGNCTCRFLYKYLDADAVSFVV